MSTGAGTGEARAAPRSVDEMRRAFDSAFAAEPGRPMEQVDLVAVRAGERSCAVRVSEIAAVVPLGGLAAMPTGDAAHLGIAAVRGAPVAVWDLAALLGGDAARAPRWMLLSAGEDRVAIAFDELEGYLRVPREDVVAGPAAAAATAVAGGALVRVGASLRPVISLDAVRTELERRLGVARKGW